MPTLLDEWLNRPARLMHLSYVEYVAEKENKPLPLPVPVVANISVAKSGGRTQHISGQMNGLEKRYAAYLEVRKLTGEIVDYRFEPLKLKLAPATFYTPDFLILMPNNKIELHETKGGFIEDDAAVKLKVAKLMFNGIFSIVLVKWDKGNKSWMFK